MSYSKKLFKPTLIGSSAILMWSTLALFTKLSGSIPPFQLTAMSFTLAFSIGLVWSARQGKGFFHHFKQPLPVWLNGVIGLFGFHFFYFMALQKAPAIEASLISYLWPLLIVLFSALLPNEKLRWYHVVGAFMGFIGAGFLVAQGKSLSFNPEYSLGYLSAFICAVTWSGYSVLSRKFGSIPTEAVGAFCGVTAILAALCHVMFEQTLWPEGLAWFAVLGLGLGPVGLAFFTWDYGIKHGSIKVLGALSYAAPLFSTLLLIGFGLAPASWMVSLACFLIVGGAVLAAGDLLKR